MAAPMKLAHEPAGNDALDWSDDNQIAVVSEKCVNIFSLQCDPSDPDSTFVFEKLLVKPCPDILEFDVGVSLKSLLKNDGKYNHYLQSTMTDRTLFPQHLKRTFCGECQTDRNGFIKAKWSPTVTSKLDRSLLACLTLDHRLTIHKRKLRKGNFTKIADLSILLNELLGQQEFAHSNEEPHPKLRNSTDIETKCKELTRRVYMLAAVNMEWSVVLYNDSDSSMDWETQKENVSSDSDAFILLAVSMKSGHVGIWKFRLPLDNESDISFYSVFLSGYQWAKSLAWCRTSPQQATSHAVKAGTCLAVGDHEGRISLWNQDARNEATPTFHKCLDVWTEKDLIAVSNMAWVCTSTTEDSTCTATLVATKGVYILAFLLDLSKMAVIRQTQALSQHVIPPTSLCVSGDTVLTGSTCGSLHQVSIDWTTSDKVLTIDILEPDIPNIKAFGSAVSPNGIFAAFPFTYHWRQNRFNLRKLNFHTVRNSAYIVAGLLNPKRYLSEKVDMLEYVRQTAVNSSNELPQELQSIADGEVTQIKSEVGQDRGHCYLLRLRRFLLRLRLCHIKGLKKELDAENEKEKMVEETESDIQKIEAELVKLHIISALQSWQYIPVPIKHSDTASATALLLMADWLSDHSETTDEPIRGLVTEVHNVFPHSSEVGRRESCDLCEENIELTSTSSDACKNGHRWKRCSLSLRLCQTTSIPIMCSHCDAMALPVPENTDSMWLRETLRERCIFCEAVFVPT
ncbi:general transcription factor 3C polypeptide 4-like [Asterias rubens]|uniref:general transcription factor 3C polypeptide 4-like n=1 Tax=Asterias rubens TaxID=7604 RepID=UPI0014559FBE|nr:general transcription factor 3C polypeptide 4-like [Asterias rubens]